MRKRIACVTAAILSISLGVSGCGLIPFEQDIPFLSSRAENAETEKKTEQQTIDEQDADTEKSTEDTQQDDGLNEGEQTDNEDTEEADEKQENPMEQAALMAVQYDYDGAIELLKSQPDYESNTDMQSAVSDYENTKATCTEYPLEQITHVFFHTLIKDTARAFDGDSDSNGYNQYMTTIDEFNKIIQSMYDKGYVMVSPHDMAVINEDGTMSRGSIMLPPGKIPFVLSQDDVSYYHYMDGDGFASKLVVDSNGEVKNEYIEDDGSVSEGKKRKSFSRVIITAVILIVLIGGILVARNVLDSADGGKDTYVDTDDSDALNKGNFGTADNSDKSFAQAMETIREHATTIEDALDSYKREGTEGDRLRFYNGSGEIAKVLVYPGSSADGVYEEYFYWGEQMFYTYVWDGDEKQYFYYQDGLLIRWIDKEGKVHDKESDNDKYVELGDKYWSNSVVELQQ